LYAWLVALKVARSSDFVLMRHIPFDPFVYVFAPFIKNRVSVHHSKEEDELRLVRPGFGGRIASFVEFYSGRFALRHARAILGVTSEIAAYQHRRGGGRCPVSVFSNGIDIGSISILADKRLASDEIHVAFLCGVFASWHGLDKLIDLHEEAACIESDTTVVIHLIGKLSAEQKEAIHFKSTRVLRFVQHGQIVESEYRPILEVCDFGLTSLALERKGIVEAATLKVREMLAMGLAVYSGHIDIALDEAQPFVRVSMTTTLRDLISFGKQCKLISRGLVREAARPLIDKQICMQRAVDFLLQLKKES
jgi:hypothetical protein